MYWLALLAVALLALGATPEGQNIVQGLGTAISTPQNIRINNPGNLTWFGMVPNWQNDPGAWQGMSGYITNPESGLNFPTFSTPQEGSRATGITALKKFQANPSLNLSDFGDMWAPPGGLNGQPGSYGASLAAYLNVDPSSPFDAKNNLANLILAIANNEGGPSAPPYFRDSVDMAAASAVQHVYA